MKKIGIITLNDDINFGNRLQNYAVQTFFEKMGFETMTLRRKEKFDIKRTIKALINYKGQRNYENRVKIFKKFNEKYIKTKIINKVKPSLNDEFTFFSTGSDQVWNPTFGAMSSFELLSDFYPEKRISFAASFGVSDLSTQDKKIAKIELSKYKSISVREDRGKEIVEELTGRKDVEVLVDPTMLLTSKEWDKISKKPTMLKNDKYILNYFLGELSDERKFEIERIAKENGCEIINMLDKTCPFYKCGPSEFLYLEKNASLICTDSFHSSIFAIIYNVPFLVFDREDKMARMSSRIETLLSKFNLKDRKYTGKITSKDLKANYSAAYKILEKEREKSKKFLEKALEKED